MVSGATSGTGRPVQLDRQKIIDELNKLPPAERKKIEDEYGDLGLGANAGQAPQIPPGMAGPSEAYKNYRPTTYAVPEGINSSDWRAVLDKSIADLEGMDEEIKARVKNNPGLKDDNEKNQIIAAELSAKSKHVLEMKNLLNEKITLQTQARTQEFNMQNDMIKMIMSKMG